MQTSQPEILKRPRQYKVLKEPEQDDEQHSSGKGVEHADEVVYENKARGRRDHNSQAER